MYDPTAPSPDLHRLLAYVADLELEVDRLRKHGGFVRHAVGGGLRTLAALADSPADGADLRAAVAAAVRELTFVLRDLHDPPGYHPADDQVVPIAVRPLAELVFGWQRRLTGRPEVELRLELGAEHVDWFPARLRHILDNLFSNALRYRDPVKAEAWVYLRVTPTPAAYELQVSDNGMGLPAAGRLAAGPLTRAAPLRSAGLAVGLPVVRLLVEQSGGTLTVRAEEGRGTDFRLTLPRYDLADYLT